MDNKQQYDEKYKVYESSINRHVYDNVPGKKTVFDVGCNAGSLGELLKREKGCVVWDINKLPLPFGKVEFDEILCN